MEEDMNNKTPVISIRQAVRLNRLSFKAKQERLRL